MQEAQVQSLGQEDPLEEETATHSSILARRIPQTEEPGRLQYMGSKSRTRLSDHTIVLVSANINMNQPQYTYVPSLVNVPPTSLPIPPL